jgi:hypothetical protein
MVLREGRSATGEGDMRLLARDSSVAILITSAECDRGRVGIPAFRELERRLKRTGMAFRVVVKSRPLAARQYAGLLGMPGAVIGDPSGTSLAA